MTGAEALLILTSTSRPIGAGRVTGAYLPELLAAWTVLSAAGFGVGVATPTGGRVPLEAVDETNPTHRQFLGDPEVDRALATAPSTRDIDRPPGLLYLVGGHGAVYDLPADDALARLVESTYRSGGVVAAVCHGPAGLLAAQLDGRPLVAGRRVACFSNAEEQAIGMSRVVPFLLADALTDRGAVYLEGPAFMPHVVTDERLVTGQNPVSAQLVAERAVTCWRETRSRPSDSAAGIAVP
jgi:putative intracellular protease/amidase